MDSREAYNEWAKTGGSNYDAFQAGVAVGARKMKEQAIAACYSSGIGIPDAATEIKKRIQQLDVK